MICCESTRSGRAIRTRSRRTNPTRCELSARNPILPITALTKQFPPRRAMNASEAAVRSVRLEQKLTGSYALALYAIERVGTRHCKPYQLVKRCCWRSKRSAALSFTKCRTTHDTRPAGVRISCLWTHLAQKGSQAARQTLGSGRKSRLARPRFFAPSRGAPTYQDTRAAKRVTRAARLDVIRPQRNPL